VQGPWKPGSCTSSGTWELDGLVAEHCERCDSAAAEEDDLTPDQANQLAAVYAANGSTQATSNNVWHQTVPDPVSGDDTAMWALLSSTRADVSWLIGKLQEAGVIK